MSTTGEGVVITADVFAGNGSLAVMFSMEESTGEEVAILWDLGDGAYSNERAPKHIYYMPGVYHVTLRYRYADTVALFEESNTITIRVHETAMEFLDICYKTGLHNNVQGYGPAEIRGENWPRPEPFTECLECFDGDNFPHRIVFDGSTGTWREISTYNGPTGSGITKRWTDAVYNPLQGNAEEEIPWDIWLFEITGTGEHFELEHIKSYLYFRPDERMRGEGGYTEDGYRDALEVSVAMIADGKEVSICRQIPMNGEITFDKKLKCFRSRLIISGTASHVRFTGHRQIWWVMDHIKGPLLSQTSESEHREKLSVPLVWLLRYRNGIVNRMTGRPIGGQDVINVASSAGVTAPDGYPGAIVSQMDYAGALPINTGIVLPSPSGPVNVLFLWGSSDARIFVDSELSLSSIVGTGEWTLYKSEYSSPGELIIQSEKVFDLRIFSGILQAAAFEYYRDNVMENNGAEVIPL